MSDNPKQSSQITPLGVPRPKKRTRALAHNEFVLDFGSPPSAGSAPASSTPLRSWSLSSLSDLSSIAGTSSDQDSLLMTPAQSWISSPSPWAVSSCILMQSASQPDLGASERLPEILPELVFKSFLCPTAVDSRKARSLTSTPVPSVNHAPGVCHLDLFLSGLSRPGASLSLLFAPSPICCAQSTTAPASPQSQTRSQHLQSGYTSEPSHKSIQVHTRHLI